MTEAVNPILDLWVESLTRVIESMIDTHPEIRWKNAEGAHETAAGSLWLEQQFQYPENARIWVATPRAAWEAAGTLALHAAGLETVQPEEARNTWIEIVGQSLADAARAIGARLDRDAGGGQCVEGDPGGRPGEWAIVEIQLAGEALAPVAILLSTELVAALESPQAASALDSANKAAMPPAPRQTVKNSPTLDFLLDIELPVSISFGSAQLSLKEVVKLNTGSIVELDRLVGDPVDVLVNQRLIARGEVVVVEGNYGVRIQEIVSQAERLRSVQ
jgi:flagellar motor switch protein FliN/FliY